MTNNIVLIDNANVPAHLRQAKVDATEWNLGGVRIPTIEVTPELITAKIGDQVVQETEDPIEVVILKASKIGRVYYPDTYDPSAAAKPPACYSVDGIHPAANAPEPQCTNCAACPQNMKGSSKQKADTKACRYRQLLAVALPAVQDKVFRLSIAATGIFSTERTRSGHLPYGAYGKILLASGYGPDVYVSELKRDMSLGYIRSVFVSKALLTAEEYEWTQRLKHSPEADQAIDLHMNGATEEGEETEFTRAAPSGVSRGQAQQYADDDLPEALRKPASRTLRMEQTTPEYARQEPEEVDEVDTYWVHEGSDAVFMVKAGEPLPQYDAFTELTKEQYTVRLKDQEAAEQKLKAEQERKALEAAKAAQATKTTSTRRKTTNAGADAAIVIKVGSGYAADPDNYTDESVTYWQEKGNKENIFQVPSNTVLPDPELYFELTTIAKAEEAVREQMASKQTTETTVRRRGAADTQTTTEGKSHRRAHNRQPANTDDEDPRVRNTKTVAGKGLAEGLRDLADD